MPNLDPRGYKMHSLQSFVAVSQLADRQAAAASARAARRVSSQRQRRGVTALSRAVVLRRAGSQDDAAIARLAELDGAVHPTGEMLVAEVDEQILAAVPLSGGRAIADPFQPTAKLVELLRIRARLLARSSAPARRLLPRLPRLHAA
jgi:hypothetical protein